MRTQTQLFLGTAFLVSTLMFSQWWLQQRQIAAIEAEWSALTTAVGNYMLQTDRALGRQLESMPCDVEHIKTTEDIQLKGVMLPPNTAVIQESDVDIDIEKGTGSEVLLIADIHMKSTDESEDIDAQNSQNAQNSGEKTAIKGRTIRKKRIQLKGDPLSWVSQNADPLDSQAEEIRVEFIRLQNHDAPADDGKAVIMIQGLGDDTHQLEVNNAGSAKVIRQTQEETLMASAFLLAFGLLASALFAHRVTKPIRALTLGAESLAEGDLGLEVEVTSDSEVGELQRAFNHMSQRLAQLEADEKIWQARAHLAELGDLSRGLAHTLRNPLHTLGLAVEELAQGHDQQGELVAMARSQIERIDRWLRSFLALGAGQNAQSEALDLDLLLQDLALEYQCSDIPIHLQNPPEPVQIYGVRVALKAALGNLLNNALEASPPDESIEILCEVAEKQAIISIIDQGPGLPEAVKARLYAPHMTTKTSGSGMGLFLAKQLIEGAHSGQLELLDGDQRGTIARITIPRYEG